jgi:hypothetical protein
MAVGDEGGEAAARLRRRIGRGDADDVEARRPELGDERLLQKSRLA